MGLPRCWGRLGTVAGHPLPAPAGQQGSQWGYGRKKKLGCCCWCSYGTTCSHSLWLESGRSSFAVPPAPGTVVVATVEVSIFTAIPCLDPPFVCAFVLFYFSLSFFFFYYLSLTVHIQFHAGKWKLFTLSNYTYCLFERELQYTNLKANQVLACLDFSPWL